MNRKRLHPAADTLDAEPGTLGAVLYAGEPGAVVLESDWVDLVRSIAAGDVRALRTLYERAHRLVFTLAMRMSGRRETAEAITLDVFHDVWRHASKYDPEHGTVLAWIMNQARSRAIERVRLERRNERAGTPPADEDAEGTFAPGSRSSGARPEAK